MKFLVIPSAVLLTTFLLVFFFFSSGTFDSDSMISNRAAEWEIGTSLRKKKSVNTGIYISESKQWLHADIVKKMLLSAKKKKSIVFYSLDNIKDFTASASGTDSKHHIVNSYLVGYKPFTTSNIWIPWQTLARKKTYQVDTLTYNGRVDVWQTSKQAYKYTRGDCEDHAIALADWLIAMGNDARVVLGTHNGGGHAWVVLFKDDKEFILEATRKSGLNKLRKFPLAKRMPGYRPHYMFNRTHFWKNTGSKSTTNYSSSRWIKKSRYNLGFSV